jgi:hypothetical protein
MIRSEVVMGYGGAVGPDDGSGHEPVEDDDDAPTEAGGKVAATDEFEVTKAQRERDWTLACQIVAGLFSGVLAAYGAAPGVILTTVMPRSCQQHRWLKSAAQGNGR